MNRQELRRQRIAIIRLLRRLGDCGEGRAWLKEQPLELSARQLWERCPSLRMMRWLAEKAGMDCSGNATIEEIRQRLPFWTLIQRLAVYHPNSIYADLVRDEDHVDIMLSLHIRPDQVWYETAVLDHNV
jgi:hypothetical protein